METKDVFISYHGGQGDESKSSYMMAEKLYEFLESKKIRCFLCKKTNKTGEFYRAIDDAIRTCKHFILVARDKKMLSEWVADEVRQFDALRKNGKKPNSVISAYIFDEITQDDLFNFNTLFAARDIMSGEHGFEQIFNLLVSTDSSLIDSENINEDVRSVPIERDLDSISRQFLHGELVNYSYFTGEDYLRHCSLITKRLKCMLNVTISHSSENVIEDLFYRIMQCKTTNLLRISGQAGTQKSYVLQLIYVHLRLHYNMHDFEPVYLHCDIIREQAEQNQITSKQFLETLFNGISFPAGRKPLFIIDGVLNIITGDAQLDYTLKRIVDSYRGACNLLGINQVYGDNQARLNKSGLIRGQYEINLNLTPISLYDKEKCIEYISTIEGLSVEEPETAYEILNKSGLLTIDESIVRTVCNYYDGSNALNIMDIFEIELLDKLYGDREELNAGAAKVYEFAYGLSEIDYTDKTLSLLLSLICKESIFLHCLIAIYFFNKLEEYDKTKDFSFFKMIFPKEITRFITSRIHTVPSYEAILLDLGEHYEEMSPMGQSEMSFFLGRIQNANYRNDAIRLLKKYYLYTKDLITQKIFDDKYRGKPYAKEENKQDLFLLRGLSVSLIYCDDKSVLKEYLRSLIENDLSNSINRGFHLEYYGDKRYLPNQNMLDYEDNVRMGERTLRILCNTVDNQLNSNRPHSALLLELFTIVSLLQVRIETDKRLISFNILPYIKRCTTLVETCFSRMMIEDNIIANFFKMALADFNVYINEATGSYSPQRDLCNKYLAAMEIKRAGWVAQNIPEPESIVEHMYSCWFIGMIFLPNEDYSVNGYDKQKILNMLLIHDLAETILSDIPKYEKINYPGYDQKENEVMLSILLKGTYTTIGALTPFVDAWDSWYEMEEENARIAKDIDTIQAIYQFLIYNERNPENFSEERKLNWIKEMLTLRTQMGKYILKQLICENDRFKSMLENYKNIVALT